LLRRHLTADFFPGLGPGYPIPFHEPSDLDVWGAMDDDRPVEEIREFPFDEQGRDGNEDFCPAALFHPGAGRADFLEEERMEEIIEKKPFPLPGKDDRAEPRTVNGSIRVQDLRAETGDDLPPGRAVGFYQGVTGPVGLMNGASAVLQNTADYGFSAGYPAGQADFEQHARLIPNRYDPGF